MKACAVCQIEAPQDVPRRAVEYVEKSAVPAVINRGNPDMRRIKCQTLNVEYLAFQLQGTNVLAMLELTIEPGAAATERLEAR